MQNRMTEVKETDFLRYHLMDTSLIISEHAITDNAPPTLGTIAIAFSMDDQLSSLIFSLQFLLRVEDANLQRYCRCRKWQNNPSRG